jgi:hypothetical protein
MISPAATADPLGVGRTAMNTDGPIEFGLAAVDSRERILLSARRFVRISVEEQSHGAGHPVQGG